MASEPAQRNPVEELAESFLARYRRGERPAVSEYTDRHPELADEIRDLFPALVLMEEAGPRHSHAAGPCGQVTADGRAPERLGDYRILREIARGGMGVVYEAVQESLGRHVALKVLPIHGLSSRNYLERFEREAKAAARLHHTNIVPVFGIGAHAGVHYYAMQYIRGQGLDAVLTEVRRLRGGEDAEPSEPLTASIARSLLTDGAAGSGDPRRAPGAGPGQEVPPGSRDAPPTSAGSSVTDVRSLAGEASSELTGSPEARYFRGVARIGVQVAEALVYAHKQGIGHRDIKPSNLLLDTQGVVWLTDFGLVKDEEGDNLTRTGDLVGTVRYMAPERFDGQGDARSDLYGLGATLYELLTLRPAFEDAPRARVIERILHGDPVGPRKLDPRIPRDLETIVLKALAKEPGRRYQTAGDLAEDLRRFLADRPIRARRISASERTWRWCRRNPAVAALLSAVFLLLSCLAAGSIAMAVRSQRHSAELAAGEADRTAKTYETYQARVAQAYVSRFSQRPGQRLGTLQTIKEAVKLVRERQMPAERLDELRTLAIAALALPDLRTLQTWARRPHDWGVADADPQRQLYARWDTNKSISLCRMSTDEVVATLQGQRLLRFSPGGRFLLTHGGNHFRVWDLSRTGPPLVDEGEEHGLAFHPDDRHLLVAGRDGSLRLHDLASPRHASTLLTTLRPPAVGLAFDPEGKRLAVTRADKAEILDARTGRVLAAIPDSHISATPAWHPGGNYLALISSRSVPEIHIWDLRRRSRLSVLKGCRSSGLWVAFTPDGDHLLSAGEEGVVRLWDWRTGRPVLQCPGSSNLNVSPAGQFLIEDHQGIHLVALVSGHEYRSFVQQSTAPDDAYYRSAIVHPGGRFLAWIMRDQVGLFDLVTGDELAAVPQARYRIAFQADGALLTNGNQGLLRWPIRETEAGHWKVGPPTLLYPQSLVDMAADRNGDVVGQATGGNGALLVRPGKGLVFLGPHGAAQHLAISPDGTLAVTGINDGEELVKIWDIRTRRLVKSFALGPHCGGDFSPDGRWLVVCGIRGGQVVRVGTWETCFVFSKDHPYSSAAFSPDGSLFALDSAAGRTRLLDPATGRELARLEDPNQSYAMLTFSPDGTKLIAASDVDQTLHVWDLRAIRAQLADMGLDWQAPAYPAAKEEPAPLPLTVTVDVGKLIVDPHQSIGLQSVRLALCPFDFDAYLQRGKAHGQLGQRERAVADYSMALALMPAAHNGRGEALFRRSNCYRTLGNEAKADADLQHLAERDLPLPEGLQFEAAMQCNNLAWRYVKDPHKDFDPHKALLLIQKSVKLDANEVVSLNTLGVTYYRLGQIPEALATLERSWREGDGQNGAFDLFFLAMCHARQGAADKARTCYDQALLWIENNQARLGGQREELTQFQAEADELLGKPK